MQKQLHDRKRQQAGGDIIKNDTGTFGQAFELADRWRLENVEDTKKYKTCEKRFPCEGCGDEGNELAGGFIDDDELRVFEVGGAGNAGGGGDAKGDGEQGESGAGVGAGGRGKG